MSVILIVEDEKHISNLLKTCLEREGYRCHQVFDGAEAIDRFQKVNPDLVILDIMLPGINGFDLCRKIREFSHVYILMLTAKQEMIDKITGLELGADDYMTKPFSVEELLTRVRVLLRRPRIYSENLASAMTIGNLEIDPIKLKVKLGEESIQLTALEFEVLYFLVRNRGNIFTRDQLLEKIWGTDSYIYDRSIDRLISRLRRKIEIDPDNPKKIVTIWGMGYKFDENS